MDSLLYGIKKRLEAEIDGIHVQDLILLQSGNKRKNSIVATFDNGYKIEVEVEELRFNERTATEYIEYVTQAILIGYNINLVKPPLGIMPEAIFEQQRIQELSRAIHDYICNYDSKDKYELISKWNEELTRRIENLNKKEVIK